MDPLSFLASLDAHKQAQQDAPNEERLFVEAQFKGIQTSLEAVATAMTVFLKSYHATASIDNFPKQDDSKVISAVKHLETALKPVKADNSDLIKEIKAVAKQIKAVELPVTESVQVTNFGELADKLEKLHKAIEAQDTNPVVNVAAPKVTVQPTPVTVQATDVSGLIKATDKVTTTLTKLRFPTPNVPTDPLIKYAEADIDDVDGTNSLKNIRYYSFTDTSGAWYIKRLDATNFATTGKSIRYAFGQSNYATNWTARASLTFTVWGL